MEKEVREVIVNELFYNNFKVTYAGDLSKLIRKLNEQLYIEIKGDDE